MPRALLLLASLALCTSCSNSTGGGNPVDTTGHTTTVPPAGFHYLFAGTYEYLYRSDDTGKTWTKTDATPHTYRHEIASMGRYTFATADTGGILRSTDNGLTWQTIYRFSGEQATAVFYHAPALFSGTSSGIYRSMDSGLTWQHVADGYYINHFIDNSHELFAASYGNGIYHSSDDGATWSHIALDSVSVSSIVMDGSVLLAGVENEGKNNGGIYRSTDNGYHWQSVDSTQHCNAITLAGTTLFANVDYPVYLKQSTDHGLTWTKSGSFSSNFYTLSSSGSWIFAGSNGDGVFVSSDAGAHWSDRSSAFGVWGVIGLGLR